MSASKAAGKDVLTLAATVGAAAESAPLDPTSLLARAVRAVLLGKPDELLAAVATHEAPTIQDFVIDALGNHRDPAGPVAGASAVQKNVKVLGERIDVLTPPLPYCVWWLLPRSPVSRAATAANLPFKTAVVLVDLDWRVVDTTAPMPPNRIIFDPQHDDRIAVDRDGLDLAAVKAVVAAGDARGARTFKLVALPGTVTTMLKDLSNPLGVATARAWVADVVVDAHVGLPGGESPTLAALLRGVEKLGSGLLYGPNADGKYVLRSKTPPVQSMAWAMFFVLIVEVVVGIENAGVNAQLRKLREKLLGLCWDPSNTRDLHNKDRRATIAELVRRAWILSAAGGRVTISTDALHECSAGVGHAPLGARVTAALEASFPVRADWPANAAPRDLLTTVVGADAAVAKIRIAGGEAAGVDPNEVAVWADGQLPNRRAQLSELARLPPEETAALVAALAPAAGAGASFTADVELAPVLPPVLVDVLGAHIIKLTTAWAASWAARKTAAALRVAGPATVAEAIAVAATAVAPVGSPLWAPAGLVAAVMAALIANEQLDVEPKVMPVPTRRAGSVVLVYDHPGAGARFLAPPPELVEALGLGPPTAEVTLVRPLPGGAAGTPPSKWYVALDAELAAVAANPTAVAAALALPSTPPPVWVERSGLSLKHLKGAALGGLDGCLACSVREWWPESTGAPPVHEVLVIPVLVPRKRPDGVLEIRPYAVVVDSATKSAKDPSARILTPKCPVDAAAFVARVEADPDGHKAGMSWRARALREVSIMIVQQPWVPAGGNGADAPQRRVSARKRRQGDKRPRLDIDERPPDRANPAPMEVARALVYAAHRAPVVPLTAMLAQAQTLCGFFAAVMGADLPEGQSDGLIEGVVAMQQTFAAWGLPTYEAAAFAEVLSPAEAAVVEANRNAANEARRSLANSGAVGGVLEDMERGGDPDCPCCAKTARLARALRGVV